MENKKESMAAYVRRLTTPIFEKVLQETPKNPMSVGGRVSPVQKTRLYQPHNLRRWIDFSKATFSPPKPGFKPGCTYRLVNSKEHFFQNYHNCNIKVKKTQIEITNLINHKRWYVIELSSQDHVRQQFYDILNAKEQECLEVLKIFIEEFGGSSNFTILNRKSEDKIIGDDRIDQLPDKMTWHTPISKKVYNEKNVEFSDSIYASNFINNRAIEEIAPQISDELVVIKEAVKGVIDIQKGAAEMYDKFANSFLPIHQEHAINIRTHTKVLKDISKGFVKFNRLLSERQRRLGDYFG